MRKVNTCLIASMLVLLGLSACQGGIGKTVSDFRKGMPILAEKEPVKSANDAGQDVYTWVYYGDEQLVLIAKPGSGEIIQSNLVMKLTEKDSYMVSGVALTKLVEMTSKGVGHLPKETTAELIKWLNDNVGNIGAARRFGTATVTITSYLGNGRWLIGVY